jgi:NADH-quinone oxidoreductase subunit D
MEQIRWALPLNSTNPTAAGGPELLLSVMPVPTEGDALSITGAEVIPGRLHRGAEKLFESRDYRAALALANRHDWLGAFGSEVSLAELLEQSLGIEVPPRAGWLRVVLAEYYRIIHHLAWLTATLAEVDPATSDDVLTSAGRARGLLVDVAEAYSGARLHPMLAVIGGLREAPPTGWLARVVASLPGACDAAQGLGEAGADSLPPDLAVLPAEAAWGYAASGPVARASGVGFDLRLDRAHRYYAAAVQAGVMRRVTAAAGDVRARFDVLVGEVAVSAAVIRYAADQLAALEPDAEVNVLLPRSIRLPEGRGYHAGENPGGINGWYVLSRGGPTPLRLKLRTSSYNNAQAMSTALTGTRLSDLACAVTSFLLIAGDIDK